MYTDQKIFDRKRVVNFLGWRIFLLYVFGEKAYGATPIWFEEMAKK